MQIPLIRGRFFTDHERFTNDHYVIISKQFATQFFAGDNPIGRHINVAWNVKPENFEIIGVVGDTLYSVTEPTTATMYFPVLSGIPERTGSTTIVARTSTDPVTFSVPIQQQVAALDPALPVYDVLTMAADSRQGNRKPELQRNACTRLCCVVAAAGRRRIIRSSLLSRDPACRRDRYPHRARRAESRGVAPGAI